MAGKRILIFNVNWLGDVLFSTAVIRNIRHNFPASFIACAIPQRCYPVLKGNPHLDEVIIFDDRNEHKGLLEKMSFVRMLKQKKFDIVFLLHRSLARALISRLADIPQRIGYNTKNRGFLLTEKINPPLPNSLHRVDYYLNLIEKAGLEVKDRHTEFFVSGEDEKFVEDFLSKQAINKDDFLVGLSPAGNWLPKRWLSQYWAALADKLIAEFNAKVIITGSAADMPLAGKIKGLMKREPVIASGVLDLKQLGALLKRLDLFVSADTGPLHIANAVGTERIVGLFGPTDPEITGPYPKKNALIIRKDVGCKIPCYMRNCKDNRCMKAITPEEVIEKIKELKWSKKSSLLP